MENFNLNEFLPYKLSILSQSVSQLFASEYATRFGLSMNQWRLLVIIGSHSPISAKDICQQTLFEKMTVSRGISTLKSRKLITTKVSKHDARINMHALTKQGQKIYDEIIPIAIRYENILLSKLTDSQKFAFEGILETLLHEADELKKRERFRDTT